MLATGPCFVGFTGGRDSSWTLAAATEAARSAGLDDPVPVTLQYTRADDRDARRAQELVVRTLGLADWERIEIDDELEVLGPYGTRAAREVGVMFPGNAYTLLPQLDSARGATLLVGLGATDFMLYWFWSRAMDVVSRRRTPGRADLGLLAMAFLPPPLRRVATRRAAPRWPLPWLRPDAQREVDDFSVQRVVDVPLRLSAAIGVQRTHRCYNGTLRSLDAVAACAGTTVLAPQLQPPFLAAVAASYPGLRSTDRLTFLRRAVGHLLPDEILSRGDRTRLHDVYFGERTRAFADSWSGEGFDESVIDAEALRSAWQADHVDWRATGLLQLAWLHDATRAGAAARSREGA